jgi:hypothetical protein
MQRNSRRRKSGRRLSDRTKFSDVPLSDSDVVNIFVDALRYVREKKKLPFRTCVVSDRICKVVRDWHPARTSFSSFSRICEYMSSRGVIEMGARVEHGKQSNLCIVAIHLDNNHDACGMLSDDAVRDEFLNALRQILSPPSSSSIARVSFPFHASSVSAALRHNVRGGWDLARTSFRHFDDVCAFMRDVVGAIETSGPPGGLLICNANLSGFAYESHVDAHVGDSNGSSGGGNVGQKGPSYSAADSRACDLFIRALKSLAADRNGPRLPFPVRFIASEMARADHSWSVSSTSWNNFDRLVLHMQAIGHVKIFEDRLDPVDGLMLLTSNHFCSGSSGKDSGPDRKRLRARSTSPSVPSHRHRLDNSTAKAIVVDALREACQNKRLPFQLSVVSDYVRRANPSWRIADTGYSSFRALAEDLAGDGHLKMERVPEKFSGRRHVTGFTIMVVDITKDCYPPP